MVNQQYLVEREKCQMLFQSGQLKQETVLAVCQERGDDWANAVQARIFNVHDLHAADAVYHRVCSANFRTMKQIPAIHEHEDSSSKK